MSAVSRLARPAAAQRPALSALILSTALAAASGPAAAAEEDTKRTEGRYFVELSEIFLSADDFDLAFAEIDPGGPGVGAAASVAAAEHDDGEPITPRIEIGLNRPSGKTTFSAAYLDFDLESSRVRQDFTSLENVVTPYLLPPGIGFLRGRVSGNTPEIVPNWANEITFSRVLDFKLGEFTVERNIFENERLRLRWIGGLRFAQLDQGLTTLVSFAPSVIETAFGRLETQDFMTASSSVTTNGVGPMAGLELRRLFGEEKRWSLEVAVDAALIPEKTRATYALGLIGNKIIPGIDLAELRDPLVLNERQHSFNAFIRQDDFTKQTLMLQGRVGFNFQPKSFFTVGLELWQLRWNDVVSQLGLIDTVHSDATYEFTPGQIDAPDPQRRDNESVIHIPRLTAREDFVFEGVAVNLKFDF